MAILASGGADSTINWAQVLAFVGIGLVLVALSENSTLGPLVLGFVVIIFLVALLHSSATIGLLGDLKGL